MSTNHLRESPLTYTCCNQRGNTHIPITTKQSGIVIMTSIFKLTKVAIAAVVATHAKCGVAYEVKWHIENDGDRVESLRGRIQKKHGLLVDDSKTDIGAPSSTSKDLIQAQSTRKSPSTSLTLESWASRRQRRLHASLLDHSALQIVSVAQVC